MPAAYDTTATYDSISLYDTGGVGPLTMARIYEIQESLNILAGTTGLDAQYAANKYAGSVGLDLQAALNCKYQGVTTMQAFIAGGYQMYDTQKVANLIAGTTSKDTQDALSNAAGGGHT